MAHQLAMSDKFGRYRVQGSCRAIAWNKYGFTDACQSINWRLDKVANVGAHAEMRVIEKLKLLKDPPELGIMYVDIEPCHDNRYGAKQNCKEKIIEKFNSGLVVYGISQEDYVEERLSNQST